MYTHNVGEELRIRVNRHMCKPELQFGDVGRCSNPICTGVTPTMKGYDGYKAIVVFSDSKGRYKLDVDKGRYGWSDCMLEFMKVPTFDGISTSLSSSGCEALTIDSMEQAIKKLMKECSFPGTYVIGREPNYYQLLRKKSMDTLKELPKTVKRFIDKNFKAFYQLGWVDQDLDLTREGGNHLIEFLFKHFEKEFGAYAIEKLAEAKKEKEDADEE